MPDSRMAAVDYLELGDEPRLVAESCEDCGALYFGRRNGCARCSGTNFRRRRLAAEGRVRAFTVVHRAARVIDTPFTSIVVELEGGGVVKSNLLGVTDPDAVEPGMRVRLTTHSLGTDDDGTEAIAFGFQPEEAPA